MVQRVRKGRKSAIAGRLEQSGNGLNIAHIVWRGLKEDEGIIHFSFDWTD